MSRFSAQDRCGLLLVFLICQIGHNNSSGQDRSHVEAAKRASTAPSESADSAPKNVRRKGSAKFPKVVVKVAAEQDTKLFRREGFKLTVEIIPPLGGTHLYNPWFDEDHRDYSSWYLEIVKPDGKIRKSSDVENVLQHSRVALVWNDKSFVWIPDTARLLSELQVRPNWLGQPASSGDYRIKLHLRDRFCAVPLTNFPGDFETAEGRQQKFDGWTKAYPGRVIASSDEIVVTIP